MQQMNLLEKLTKYYQHTPSFHYITRRFFPKTPLVFDHVAHRSFGYTPILSYYAYLGFKQQPDLYHFPHMNVHAIWLKHPMGQPPKADGAYPMGQPLKADGAYPSFRVFLSQYEEPVYQQIKSYEDYERIQKQNDYVAWTLLHKDDINHIAIQVPNLDTMVDIIKRDGHLQLNNPTKPIEESADGNLRQASTVADKMVYTFPNGDTREVPYAFVEFVERRNGREGFETKNAAQIFTSTHLGKK